MTRELIAETEFYKLEVDAGENRSYSIYRGFWPDTEEFKQGYYGSMQKLISRLRSGFTTVVDVRDFKLGPQGVMDTIVRVQGMMKEAGVRKSARITDQPIHKLASDRIGREADMKESVGNFNSVPEALAWLDS
jgi:hypothetical protein